MTPESVSSSAATGITATAEQRTVAVHLEVTDEVANDLYNDLYRLQYKCGFPASGWRDEYPALFNLYDSLAKVGVDGTR